jgi:hypothetical protein
MGSELLFTASSSFTSSSYHSSVHFSSSLFTQLSLSSVLSLFSHSPTQLKGEKRVSTSSFLVFCRECSGFEFRSASTAHTWLGIGSRAGAKPVAGEGSAGRLGLREMEGGRYSVMRRGCESTGGDGAQGML